MFQLSSTTVVFIDYIALSLVLMTCALIYVVVVPKRRREKANTAWEANLLSKLPIELRLKIYRHLLVTQDDTKDPGSLVRRMNRFDAHFRKPPDFDATILRACRQVYTEALPILYGENIFECSALEGLQVFSTTGLDIHKADRKWSMPFQNLSFGMKQI